MTRKIFYVSASEQPGTSIATMIKVKVPEGLTRDQAIDYVTGRITGEVARYFASECLALGPIDHTTNWSDKIT